MLSLVYSYLPSFLSRPSPPSNIQNREHIEINKLSCIFVSPTYPSSRLSDRRKTQKNKSIQEAVSYTHLDVYKRQIIILSGVFLIYLI